MVDLVKSLTKKHRSDNNFKHPKLVYISQCRKPKDMKAAMYIAHTKLVRRIKGSSLRHCSDILILGGLFVRRTP